MSMMASRNAVEFDGEARTLLAPPNGSLHNGVGRSAGTAVAVDRLDAALWQAVPNLALGLMVVNFHVSEISGVGSEFVFALEGHDSDNFGSARTPLVSMKLVTDAGPGLYKMAIDGASVLRLLPDITHMALSTTRSVGDPFVTFRAWLSFAKAS